MFGLADRRLRVGFDARLAEDPIALPSFPDGSLTVLFEFAVQGEARPQSLSRLSGERKIALMQRFDSAIEHIKTGDIFDHVVGNGEALLATGLDRKH